MFKPFGSAIIGQGVFMTKLAYTILLITITISGLAFVNSINPTSGQTGTEVNGIISSNTTWTQANSPYTFTGPVAVNVGVTLTIQAGVTININSLYYLQVNGTLVAIGANTNQIRLSGGYIKFMQSSTSWNQQTQTGCIIDNAVLTCSIDIYNASPLISNNQLLGES